MKVVERHIPCSELYTCDEMFFTGTAVEIAPIIRVDHRSVGSGQIGPITALLRRLYLEATHRRLPGYRHWVVPSYRSTAPAKVA